MMNNRTSGTFGATLQDVSSSGDAGDAESPHQSEAVLSPDALVSRLRAGDRLALEELLNAARPRLTAVALKIVRDADDAEDVVQDAMLKVWRYLGRFEGRAALSTWLHRILVNTAVDHLRARRARLGSVSSIGGGSRQDDADARPIEAVCHETPEDALARAQIGEIVRQGMSHLSVVHRQVLALRELEGESYQAIAQLVRCPVGTVMSRLHHARQRLAQTLSSQAFEQGVEQGVERGVERGVEIDRRAA